MTNVCGSPLAERDLLLDRPIVWVAVSLHSGISTSIRAKSKCCCSSIARLCGPSCLSRHLGPYPDDELAAIVAAAVRATATSAPAVLEGFGEFVAPGLITTYRRLIRPEWRTLDVLANTERTIQVFRLRNPGAEPPLLRCARPTPDRVIITYASVRRLCSFARGIIKEIAGHYGERVEITEATCMHGGAAACILSVRELSTAER
jgi:hypothetical protein